MSPLVAFAGSSYSAPAAQKIMCVEAAMPTGKFNTYSLPKISLDGDNPRSLSDNKRQLKSEDAKLTPDTSMVYNAYFTQYSPFRISLTLENKPLTTGASSNRHLIYELQVQTANGIKFLRHYLFNTDTCNKDIQIPGGVGINDAIVDAKIYWIDI